MFFLLQTNPSVLDFEKIDSGQIELHKKVWNLPELLSEMKVRTLSFLKTKSLRVNYHVPEDIPNFVFTDGIRYTQVLFNLISNSFKFTPENGTIDITFSIEICAPSSYEITFKITDQGPGLSPEAVQDLFRPYSQVKHQNQNQAIGTGLGLAITHRIVELFQGTIKVESQVGVGTTFIVVVPMEMCGTSITRYSSQATIGPTAVNTPEFVALDMPGMDDFVEAAPLMESQLLAIEVQEPEPERPLSILAVDDAPINRKIMAKMLSKAITVSYSLEEATDGDEAVELARSGEFDVIFMDIIMPRMDGLTAAKKIREFDDRVLIIACTANSVVGEKAESELQEAGLNDALGKPFTIDMLKSKLEKYGLL